jgi:hypothetical protein
MSAYGVVLVHTTSAALRSEKTLQRAGLTVKLIPTPRQFSSDCGIALRFDWAEAARVQALLEAAGVDVDQIPLLE